jgi:Tfp pilus assembly PilM family ATPase
MVIRTFEVTPVQREGENLVEIICVAISRDTVMRYVELLRRCKLEVVGVHSEVIAMVNAFGFGGAPGENVTVLYVDLGAHSTKVAIAHGTKAVFARHIPLGGQHLDQKLAESLGCDLATARAHRLSEQALAAANPAKVSAGPTTAVSGGNGDESGFGEVVDSIADELSMGIRYHQSLFRGRKIDKVVFVGGEARNIALCQSIAKVLRLPAQLGDPLSSISTKRSARTHGLTLGQPQPGWAVACGLANSPTDL